MFQELGNGSSAEPLVDAEQNHLLTMLVGRDAIVRETLQQIGQQDHRATFLVEDSTVYAEGQEERWFGNDPSIVLVLLNYDAPNRTAAVRWDANADPFDIGQAVLDGEANQ